MTVKLSEWLEGQDFYELMQTYRHADVLKQPEVGAAFEEVKARIKAVHFGIPEEVIHLIPDLPTFMETWAKHHDKS